MPTSSDDDGVCSAIRGVLQHLPPTIQPFWLDLEMIHTILKQGGYPMLPFDAVVNAMKGGRSSGVPALDRFHQNGGHSRTYYKFSSIFEGYKCYKDQRDAWVMIPRVHPKWFVKHKSNFQVEHDVPALLLHVKQGLSHRCLAAGCDLPHLVHVHGIVAMSSVWATCCDSIVCTEHRGKKPVHTVKGRRLCDHRS